MKKLFSLIICIALLLFSLTSCTEAAIGAFKENYKDKIEEGREVLEINLYMLYDEGTVKSAYDTVQQRIESYTLTTYDTAVKVIYCSAEDYETTVKSASNPNAGENKADIVMISSPNLFNYLYDNDRLADLTEYLASKEYGTLNKTIANALIEASYIKTGTEEIDVTDEDGNTVKQEVDVMSCFSIPNNRVVGEYEYLLINRAAARKYFYSDNALAEMNSLESVTELKAKMTDNGDDPDEFIKVVKGLYGDRFTYESQGYACNVLSVPTINRDYALTGAFAIVNTTKDVARAMEIIYAINTDATLHNYLQYGIAPTNYTYNAENNTAVRQKEGNSVYLINPIYAGDIFKSHLCEEFGWNAKALEYGIIQNNEAIYVE